MENEASDMNKKLNPAGGSPEAQKLLWSSGVAREEWTGGPD